MQREVGEVVMATWFGSDFEFDNKRSYARIARVLGGNLYDVDYEDGPYALGIHGGHIFTLTPKDQANNKKDPFFTSEHSAAREQRTELTRAHIACPSTTCNQTPSTIVVCLSGQTEGLKKNLHSYVGKLGGSVTRGFQYDRVTHLVVDEAAGLKFDTWKKISQKFPNGVGSNGHKCVCVTSEWLYQSIRSLRFVSVDKYHLVSNNNTSNVDSSLMSNYSSEDCAKANTSDTSITSNKKSKPQAKSTSTTSSKKLTEDDDVEVINSSSSSDSDDSSEAVLPNSDIPTLRPPQKKPPNWKPSDLAMGIDTPTKRMIDMSAMPQRNHPHFDSLGVVKGKNVVKYKAIEMITAMVNVDDVNALLDIEVKNNKIESCKFKSGVDKSDTFNVMMKEYFPTHIPPMHRNSTVRGLDKKDGRGRKSKLPGAVVHFNGKCEFHNDGCGTTWDAGFSYESIVVAGNKSATQVEAMLKVNGEGCVHPEKARRGRCSGSDRKRVADEVSKVLIYLMFSFAC